jgi:DNA repair exonuclease SbcCD ATPase subunit
MTPVVLVSVEIENFKSFKRGKWEPSIGAGFKFLGGDNQQEPRLGANGAGKSSLLDALFWCLYGVGVRGQRASELVRWGAKRPRVAVELKIAGRVGTIERWGNPATLNIGITPASQEEVDALLGLTQAQFRHAVLFGQNVPFFADLPIPQRGALLEEVLELDVWNHASEAASAALSQAETRLSSLALEKARKEGALEALPSEKGLRLLAAEWKKARADELAQEEASAQTFAVEFAEAKGKLKKLRGALGEELLQQAEAARALVRAKQKAVDETGRGISRIEAKAEQAQKTLRALRHVESCPTCGQAWPAKQRAKELAAAEEAARLAAGEATTVKGYHTFALEQLQKAQEGSAEVLALVGETERAIALQEAAAANARRHWDRINTKIEQLEAPKKNPWRTKLQERAAQEEELREAIVSLDAAAQKVAGEKELAQFWRQGFKRVRLFMIRRVLQHLEIEVEAAVASLGLVGWSIRFATETETKSGSLKQGVQIIVTSPTASASWESWSGGEGQRLRMAISLGLSSMLQRVAGVRYSFELWDEPSAWLSEQGIEDLLATLRQRASDEQRSLWLVDHRAIHQTAFDEVWVVRKDAEGSRVSQI